MALKPIRVIARRTEYFFVDMEAHSKTDAMEQAWEIPENRFSKLDKQTEWKVLDAVLMDKPGKVDELKAIEARK